MTAGRAEPLQANAAMVGNPSEIFNPPAGAAMPAPNVVEDALLHNGRNVVPQRLRGGGERVACHEANLR